MDRRQFMKELRTSFVNTFREAAAPLVEKDITRLTKLADTLSGYTFHRVALPAAGPRMDIVAGQALLLYKDRREWNAYSAACPSCGQLLHYLVHNEAMKCFSCESEYKLGSQTSLVRYPVRQEKNCTLVGLPERK